MLSALAPAVAEHRKHLDAIQRAVPVTRMVDYGVPRSDALQVHQAVAAPASRAWHDVCEELAQRRGNAANDAERAGDIVTACREWRSSSALLQCAQLACNEDGPRKIALYEQSWDMLRRCAALTDDLEACVLPTAQGDLHGWVVRPTQPARAAVLVVGGLSGWGSVYLDMGRALAARGIVAVLAEGPGQGLSRLRSGLHLTGGTLPLFSEFLSAVGSQSVDSFGVWGNSFGGLFAAHIAVRDSRVRAVCTNGAPIAPTVPTFRTAREQMHAAFGTTNETALADRLQELTLDPRRPLTEAAMLVVEGGSDALVPIGSQAAFFALSSSDEKSTFTWADGEHTIYNHAQERNQRVADWFAHRLLAAG